MRYPQYMSALTANGLNIEYDTFGSPDGDPLLLIHGLGTQLIGWPEGLCDGLAARGFYVIRFDNRDVGLSSKIENGPVPDLAQAMQGDYSSASYTLLDMATDALGVLDAFGFGRAHIVGASMGGMIAQELVLAYPERAKSLASIMSTTGNPAVGASTPEATVALFTPTPPERDAAIAKIMWNHKTIGSTGFPWDDDFQRERAARAFDRSYYPMGIARQLIAIGTSGDRTEKLGAITAPTVVIHGEVDPLVTISGGEATAAAVPGAKMVRIPGMGHDLPEGAWPVIIEAIAENAARAS